MRKTWKKLMTFALAGTMAIGMSTTAFAAASTPTTTTKNETSQYTNSGDTVASDTDKINLIKDYVRGQGTAEDSSSPAEDFVFTITPYGVWNAGSSTGEANGAAYTKANMPALAKTSTNVTENGQNNVVTVSAGIGQAGNTNSKVSTEISLNDFKSVGDFWYEVKETNAKTTGVFYGTNDRKTATTTAANGGHDATYYIHVQVVNNTSGQTPKFLRSVTLHKTAPVTDGETAPATNEAYNTWVGTNNENYQSDKKVNDVQNTYYAGDLSVKKEVTGNAGDKEKFFQITVTFTKPEGTIINSDIPFTAFKETTESSTSKKTYESTNFVIKGQNSKSNTTGKEVINWTDKNSDSDSKEKTATCTFWVKHDTEVKFKNIPYGINYTIQETKPGDDTYKHQFTFDSEDTKTNFNGLTNLTADKGTNSLTDNFTDKAEGSVTDKEDKVTITNTKNNTIDVGVITSNAPYIAMLLVAGVAVVMFIKRRRGMIEE